ncbi:MAG: glycerophosphodiester phosphodiesterase [Armatimonadetes bacterium]|nr:glycerophosphodiester phosphodiesterase [Armatimonadota bacterium]
MTRRFHKVGHRGAPFAFPSNTLKSFEYAIELGCTMVECDIRPAKDGVLVLAHDDSVVDSSGNRYLIAEQNSEFLAHLNLGAGEGVPTLQTLVEWALGRCAVMADMKCEGENVEEQVAQILAPLSPELKIVPGAGAESRAVFRSIDQSLPLSFSLDASYAPLLPSENLGEQVAGLDVQAVTWQYPLLTPQRIEALHAYGLQVFAWTVDDFEIQQRLHDWGVDGVISNRADLLQKL